MNAVRRPQSGIALADFLTRPLFAHLATTSKTGPYTTPLWFSWEAGSIWLIGNLSSDPFPAHIAREPRCAISIMDFERQCGLVQHVELRGRAIVERWDQARALRLTRRYLGLRTAEWDPRLCARLEHVDNVLIRFAPEAVSQRRIVRRRVLPTRAAELSNQDRSCLGLHFVAKIGRCSGYNH